MRKIVALTVAFMFLFLVGSALAEDAATKEECVAKVEEAAALIQEQGIEAALPTLNQADGPFVWKDSYVFVLNLDDSTVLAHPVNPNLLGKDLTALKDSSGRLFFAEFIDVAKTQGTGWVEYEWPKPGEDTPSPKLTYVMRVPDTNIAVLAGVYPE